MVIKRITIRTSLLFYKGSYKPSTRKVFIDVFGIPRSHNACDIMRLQLYQNGIIFHIFNH